MTGNRWEAEFRAKVVALFHEGLKPAEIARKLNVRYASIEDFLSRNGLRTRVSYEDRRSPVTDFVSPDKSLDNVLTGTPVKGRSALDRFSPPYDPNWHGWEGKRPGERTQPWHPLKDRQQGSDSHG